MNDTALTLATQDIVIDDFFPHAPETIWKVLTTGALIGRWLMVPTGFAPVEGNRFTYRTTPAGEWDGVIHCEVLEVVPNERFSYRWVGGHEGNEGYGSLLDSVVTFTLSRAEGGTRIRFVHSGFVLPRNTTTLAKLEGGWKQVVRSLEEYAARLD